MLRQSVTSDVRLVHLDRREAPDQKSQDDSVTTASWRSRVD